jgi:xanthine dehydrogenase accessory factor
VLKTVRLALADGRARVVRIAPSSEGELRELDDVLEFGMSCHSGGTVELFVDPMLARARLTVVGDSPLAVALSSLGPRVGLPVTVVAHAADAARFPDAERVLDSDDAPAVAQALAPGSFVVVATQGRRDVQGLRAALAARARQVFFVASHRKALVLKAALVEAGEDAAAVAAIVAPAGQPIGAQTPEEIALSVLAAVVAARRGQQAPAQAPNLTPTPGQASTAQQPSPRAEHAAAAAASAPSALPAQAETPTCPPAADDVPEFVVRAGPMSCCGM